MIEAGGKVSHVEVDYGGEVRSTIVATGPTTHRRVLELLDG